MIQIGIGLLILLLPKVAIITAIIAEKINTATAAVLGLHSHVIGIEAIIRHIK